MIWIAVALFGCHSGDTTSTTDDEPKDTHATDTSETTDTDLPTETGDTATTTTPGTTPTTVDCTNLPTNVVPTQIKITTEEDFDFDLRGYLVFQQGSDIVGNKFDGTFKVIAPQVSSDAAGIQVLSTGDLIVASPDTGALKYVYRDTGASEVLIGGLSSPNGLEVGPDDVVYFTEYFAGRVRWINPITKEVGTISSSVDLPNGLAFSPDSQILYVTANGAGSEGILKFTWTGTEFDEGQIFMAGAPGDLFDSVETDLCGNVYTTEYNTGHVFRISPDGLLREQIADLDDSGFSEFSAIKWGNNVDNWLNTTLYATNRNKIFAMDMGVPGTPDVLPPF